MANQTKIDDIEILASYHDYKKVECLGCGSLIREGAMLVCAECLDIGCEEFLEKVTKEDD